MTPIYIIAEIASAHNGNPLLAKKLLNCAVETGADAVKFQIFKRQNLLSSFHESYDQFESLEISFNEWDKILLEASEYDIDLIIEPFDIDSLEFAKKYNFVSGYKVPTSDIGNDDLISQISYTGKNIYLGAGGATKEELSYAINLIENITNLSEIILMHGFQNFPTKVEDSNLARIDYLRKCFNRPVGYADHTDSEDQLMSNMIPCLSVFSGASTIEKHITLNREEKGPDYYSSFNPDEFKKLVELLRNMNSVYGNIGSWDLSNAELQYRKLMKKYAVASTNLKTGEKINKENIVFKRTNSNGITSLIIKNYFGQSVNRDIEKDEPISLLDLNNE